MSHTSALYKRNILVIFAADSNNIFYAVWKHSRYSWYIIDVIDERNVRTVKILSAVEFLRSIENGEYILPTQNQQSLADANDYKIGILKHRRIS
jgi:hypothetical protein